MQQTVQTNQYLFTFQFGLPGLKATVQFMILRPFLLTLANLAAFVSLIAANCHHSTGIQVRRVRIRFD